MVKLGHYVGAFASDFDANNYVVGKWGLQALVEGLLYRNSGTGKIRIYNGSSWDEIGGGGGISVELTETFDGPHPALFTLSFNYIPGSSRVYLNGQRLRPGPTYDYIEGPLPPEITLNTALPLGESLIVDYVPL